MDRAQSTRNSKLRREIVNFMGTSKQDDVCQARTDTIFGEGKELKDETRRRPVKVVPTNSSHSHGNRSTHIQLIGLENRSNMFQSSTCKQAELVVLIAPYVPCYSMNAVGIAFQQNDKHSRQEAATPKTESRHLLNCLLSF